MKQNRVSNEVNRLLESLASKLITFEATNKLANLTLVAYE